MKIHTQLHLRCGFEPRTARWLGQRQQQRLWRSVAPDATSKHSPKVSKESCQIPTLHRTNLSRRNALTLRSPFFSSLCFRFDARASFSLSCAYKTPHKPVSKPARSTVFKSNTHSMNPRVTAIANFACLPAGGINSPLRTLDCWSHSNCQVVRGGISGFTTDSATHTRIHGGHRRVILSTAKSHSQRAHKRRAREYRRERGTRWHTWRCLMSI
jgi:hypothetical protein